VRVNQGLGQPADLGPILHCDATAVLWPGLHFHFAAYKIRLRSFRVSIAMNPIAMDSTSAQMHGTTMLHSPRVPVASFSRPVAKSTMSTTIIPHAAAQRQVRTQEAMRLGREKSRSDPADSIFEMRSVAA